MANSRLVDIRGLKHWASNHLMGGSRLRELILCEDDYLSVDEFVYKMMVWLGLSRIEDKERMKN